MTVVRNHVEREPMAKALESLRQEERERLKALRASVLDTLEALPRMVRDISKREHQVLASTRHLVAQESTHRAFAELMSLLLLLEERDYPAGTSSILLNDLRWLNTLEVGTTLGGPLGEERTTGAIFARAQAHPEDLVATLLATVEEERPREENLLLNLDGLIFCLNKVLDATPAEDTPEVRARVRYCNDLHRLFRSWTGALDELEEDEGHALLALLLDRLERCQDVAALQTHWRLPRFVSAPDYLGMLLALLQEVRRGFAPGDARTEDALAGAVFALHGRLEDFREPSEDEVVGEALKRLLARQGHLVRDLRTLEDEGLSTMPLEMREAFLERALWEQVPRELQELLAGVVA